MTRYLNKAQTIELLNTLNINHDGITKFNDLKRLLFDNLPNYHGKKKYNDISNYIEAEIVPQRIQETVDDLDIFNNYQPPQPIQQITPSALMTKDRIMKQINDNKNFEVDFGSVDIHTQEDYLMSLIQTLRAFKPKTIINI